jgi:hypothetical protein
MSLPQPSKNPSHPTTIDSSALSKQAQDYAKLTGYRCPTKGTAFQDYKGRSGTRILSHK